MKAIKRIMLTLPESYGEESAVWRSPREESQASETYLDRAHNHFIFEYTVRISRRACYKQRAINYDEEMADGM